MFIPGFNSIIISLFIYLEKHTADIYIQLNGTVTLQLFLVIFVCTLQYSTVNTQTEITTLYI